MLEIFWFLSMKGRQSKPLTFLYIGKRIPIFHTKSEKLRACDDRWADWTSFSFDIKENFPESFEEILAAEFNLFTYLLLSWKIGYLYFLQIFIYLVWAVDLE